MTSTQMKEAVLLASDMLVSPARWDQQFRRAAASTTLSALYDYPTVRSERDHIVRAVNDFGERLFKATFMGAHLVQFLPWLRHLPSRRVPPMPHHHRKLIEKFSKSLAKWKQDAEAWYKQDTAMFDGLLHMVEANTV